MMKWVKDIEEFVRDNNDLMNNRQMAELFGCAPSTVSWVRCQLLGLKKMELEYWTPVQVEWLKRLYKYIGDYELALIFEEAYQKEKPWTLKHIEKKRKYLGLKRTREEIRAIKRRNAAFGCWKVHERQTTKLIDSIVVLYICGKTRYWDLKEEVSKRPDLIELKRQQIILKRLINEHKKSA